MTEILHDPLLIWQAGFPALYALMIAAILRLNRRSERRSIHFSARMRLDEFLPFRPGLSPIYFSAYGLGVVAYLATFLRPELPRVVFGYLLVFLASALFFWFLPSRIARGDPSTSPLLRARWLGSFQRAAKPFNNFPSLHTAYCVFSTAVVLAEIPSPLGWWLLLWATLVILSTLLTKQHDFLDDCAGALIGVAAFLAVLR